jgi:hypothetical protein
MFQEVRRMEWASLRHHLIFTILTDATIAETTIMNVMHNLGNNLSIKDPPM